MTKKTIYVASIGGFTNKRNRRKRRNIDETKNGRQRKKSAKQDDGERKNTMTMKKIDGHGT